MISFLICIDDCKLPEWTAEQYIYAKIWVLLSCGNFWFFTVPFYGLIDSSFTN